MIINNEFKSLKEIFNEALGLRNLDVKKLSEMTDIPVHYLSAISSGDPRKLPASPYVRGYLAKIADVLKVDRDSLLEAYKQENSLWPAKSSGPEDKLPSNRYALKSKRKIAVIGAAAAGVLVILIFLTFQFSGFLGNPKIEITNPVESPVTVTNPIIKLTGIINPQDKLTINNEEVLAKSDGRFEKEFLLQPDLNTVKFKVKRFLGKEITITKIITYQPETITE
ncbi:MAG: helix-turn-helix domain-containing protein [Spirochaetia bacterium]|nr:MAG: helix-turn-helix domain-containing protein [Spirochaetia bacterium]